MKEREKERKRERERERERERGIREGRGTQKEEFDHINSINHHEENVK